MSKLFSMLFICMIFSSTVFGIQSAQKEDEMILHALDFKNRNDNKKALEIFSKLLNETKKIEYAEEVLLLQIADKQFNNAKNTIKNYPKLEKRIAPKTLGYIFTKLNDFKKAINYYKIDCENSDNIQSCVILLEYYEKQKDVKSMVKILAKLYNNFKEKNEMMKAVEVSNTMTNLLKSLSLNEVKVILQELFDLTGEYNFLAKLAMLEYESAKDKNLIIASVSEKFEKAIEHTPNHVYLNFYGYLLIDHDIDYQKGISLVKKALEVDSGNDAYLDSLAWGYYKIGNCIEAKENMKKVVDRIGLEEPEIKMHWEKIQKCEGKK